jgi:hypothetical protein
MTFSVIVSPLDNRFTAALVGEPEVRAVGPTREAAIAALRAEVTQRVDRGELVTLDVDSAGITGLAGKYRDDPTLEDICAEAYRERDAEIKVGFSQSARL